MFDPREGHRGEHHGEQERAGGAEEPQLAPVDGVGDRPAVQPEEDQRDERAETDQPDGEGGPGDVVDLEGDGQGGHALADPGNGVPEPEPPVVGRGAQGCQVGEYACAGYTLFGCFGHTGW